MLELSDALVSMADEYTAGIIVNDRVDVALLARARGVHVGQDDLAPAAARDQLGPAAIVGYSTHSVRQVEAAPQDPVSYIAVGPVFGTSTKDTGYSAVGLGLVSAAARLARPIPVVAIGGVTLDNARSAIDAGASAVAVISDLLTDDPAARVRAYLQILE
jgi:thiamine-phosphate pyrophosphorylase